MGLPEISRITFTGMYMFHTKLSRQIFNPHQEDMLLPSSTEYEFILRSVQYNCIYHRGKWMKFICGLKACKHQRDYGKTNSEVSSRLSGVTGLVTSNEQAIPLEWRHNERDCVSKHRSPDCLVNRLFRRRSKKTSKPRVTGLCAGSSPVAGEFPAQRASNTENVSIWWRHHFYPPGCCNRVSHRTNFYLHEEEPHVFIVWCEITF